MRKVDEAEEQAAIMRRRKKKILAAVVLGLMCVSLFGWWRKTLPPAEAVLVPKAEVAEAARKDPGDVVIYVSGLVEHPGVVKIHAGSRAIDAVNAAGGVLPGADVSKVNLAQALRDGMQIHVPGTAQQQKDSGPSQSRGVTGQVNPSKVQPSAPPNAEPKININTSDAAELDTLPGVGPSMAARIVEWRQTNGPFQDGSELKKVKGIGEAKYQKLKDRISW